ncbi:S8 family serine peptidase [Rufibacter glacialis]|uniref:Serine protease n=1 Tax=Rufibacter glacialis TaxID=1259555 RepID=A0A5M8QIU8_9BACT|nr:S8 family serine peptidase [Rufibacter glacialis]KAA6434693.1 S8 family serine peptidase [Rufibacter glacialis]GGK71653.1 hypothetical protein GCM10011405_19830 [Rufibacter glacialis]
MASLTPLQWKVIQQAADQYQNYASQIERVRQDIVLVKQGTKDITEISPDPNRVKARISREMSMAKDTSNPAKFARERVILNPDFQEACLLNRLVDFARTVGRVMLPDSGYGTGWLIGQGLLITNHHVLPNKAVAEGSFLNLGYERTVVGEPLLGETFRLRPDLFFMTPRETPDGELQGELDFTIVGVEEVSSGGKPLSDYGYVVLDDKMGKAIEGENCLVIQHPAGDYKKVVLRDIRLLAIQNLPGADYHLYYESDTLQGSSGSIVIALGTGEIIALHNASVPRKDAQGRFLKKDSSPWQEGESEDLIDWVANQGVRISKIVEALRNFPPLSPEMEAKRRDLLDRIDHRVKSVVVSAKPAKVSTPSFPSEKAEAKPEAPVLTSSVAQRFLVKASSLPLVREYVVSAITQQFPASHISSLLEGQEDTRLGAYLKVDLSSAADPWVTAAALEAIDGVEVAEPDLPRFTSIGGLGDPASESPSLLPRLTESGRGSTPTETDWVSSPYFKKLDRNTPAGKAQIRKWSHRAVNFSETEITKLLGRSGLEELSSLRLAQFDTGYTTHSKVKGGFNLNMDYDAIEEDNEAMDARSGGILKHFGHGTRTGSILIGVSDSEVSPSREGNVGLLRAITEKDKVPLVITPFRVAKSVILIGRISELVDAATRAISSGYQVLTMSMGVLPGGPVLRDLARSAYERGVIWCCAAGNEVKVVVAPAKYPGVISVAASNPDDAPWTGSCRGPEVDITAPGEFIYVPVLGDGNKEDMTFGNGTSYATPHVAAAALLWLAKNKREIDKWYTQPWQRVEAFRFCLQKSARKEGKLPSNQFGAGLLDIGKLLVTPLPQPGQLRHAYMGSAGLEKAQGKPPLALREMEYKDWQAVFSEPLKGESTLLAKLQERTGSAAGASRSAASVHFARSLEAGQAGSQTAVTTVESMGSLSTTPEAAYARLLSLNQVRAQAKPSYAIGEDNEEEPMEVTNIAAPETIV